MFVAEGIVQTTAAQDEDVEAGNVTNPLMESSQGDLKTPLLDNDNSVVDVSSSKASTNYNVANGPGLDTHWLADIKGNRGAI